MKKTFSWKAFISFGLTYSFVIIFISGIMLYASPPGRYAHWVDWKLIGFTKEGWQGIHILFSFAFVILSIFHLLTINWTSFLSYLKSKKRKGLNKKREFYLSSVLTLLFFFGIIYSIPPFKYVTDFGEYLTQSWERVEDEPPVPHTELFTLTDLSKQIGYSSVDEITAKLKSYGIKFKNTDKQTLQEIAHLNKTTPIEIYEKITKNDSLKSKSGVEKFGGHGSGQGSVGGGRGAGRKTLESFASDVEKNVDEVLLILKQNNIKAKKGQTLREISDNNNVAPRDIFDLFSEN